MQDESAPVEKPVPDKDDTAAELILSPPQDLPIVADTTGLDDRVEVEAQFVDAKADSRQAVRVRRVEHRETRTIHIGPIPDPDTIRKLAKIYPDAPKIIFEDFHAQSSHRREMERSVILTKNRLALQGQIIAGIIGGSGVIGSRVVAAMGQPLLGFTGAMGSLATLVGLYIYGLKEQKKERLQKEEIRERMKRSEPIEELEK